MKTFILTLSLVAISTLAKADQLDAISIHTAIAQAYRQDADLLKEEMAAKQVFNNEKPGSTFDEEHTNRWRSNELYRELERKKEIKSEAVSWANRKADFLMTRYPDIDAEHIPNREKIEKDLQIAALDATVTPEEIKLFVCWAWQQMYLQITRFNDLRSPKQNDEVAPQRSISELEPPTEKKTIAEKLDELYARCISAKTTPAPRQKPKAP